jgi:ABC-2 type transport system ATP-binding protein
VIDLLKYHKAYGRHEVLSIPDLSFPDGIHWIKGINGSGKSTLLKSIAGIIPFKGDILVNGDSIKQNPVKVRQTVTYSEAEPAYPVFLTARDILDFVAQTRNYSHGKVDKIMDYFEVSSFKNQAIGGYSAGMLKKLSLCISFCGNISWILLDEPFAFIDNETEKRLILFIEQKVKQGVNFLITSHHELSQEEFRFNNIFSISGNKLQEEK